jgi:hypothetical protein
MCDLSNHFLLLAWPLKRPALFWGKYWANVATLAIGRDVIPTVRSRSGWQDFHVAEVTCRVAILHWAAPILRCALVSPYFLALPNCLLSIAPFRMNIFVLNCKNLSCNKHDIIWEIFELTKFRAKIPEVVLFS